MGTKRENHQFEWEKGEADGECKWESRWEAGGGGGEERGDLQKVAEEKEETDEGMPETMGLNFREEGGGGGLDDGRGVLMKNNNNNITSKPVN